jgi:hypothetical protein
MRNVVTLHAEAERQRARRGAIASAVVLATAAVAAAVMVVVVRNESNGTTAVSVPDAAASSLLDRLLFPPVASDFTEVQAFVGPELDSGASGLVRSPAGALFRVVVNSRGASEATPNVETQAHNDRTYTVEEVSGIFFYLSLDACARVGVLQSSASGQAWSAEVSTVLDSLEVVGQRATLTLPGGWESYGTGVASTPIQLSFSARIGSDVRHVNMVQIPDSPVSTVMFGDEPLIETTIDGQIAWFRNGPIERTLFWEDGGTAVSLSSTEATVGELQQMAGELEHGHADDWASHIKSFDSLPTGTLPPDASVPAAACGSPQLSIRAG